MLKERHLTIIDLGNRAEKLGLITTVDDLFEIKDIRNDIAHEYIQEIIYELFEKVLNISDILFSCIEQTNNYIKYKLI